MPPKLKELLARQTELLIADPGERDEKALAQCLKDWAEWKDSDEAKGYAGTPELTEFVELQVQQQKDIDALTEQVRTASRGGLSLNQRRVEVLDFDRIMSLRKVKHVFRYKDQAEMFGAMCARAIFGRSPRYTEYIPERTRGMADEIVKALDPGASGSGAELVAALYMADLIAHVEAVGVFFNQCDRVPLLTTGQTTWPKLTGELTAYPTAAMAAMVESAPTFGTVTMTPVKWGVLTPIPNEFFKNPTLLDALGQRIAWLITRAIAYAYDNAMVNGDGSADYGNITGVLEDANLTAVAAAATHTTLALTDGTDVSNIIAGLAKDYVRDPRWYMSLSAERKLRALKADNGEPLYQRGSNGEPNTIDDYPYSTCQRFPAAGAATAGVEWGVFGDLRLSHYFGMMGGIEIAQSEHVRFESDMTVVRGIAYADAALKDADAIVVAETAAA